MIKRIIDFLLSFLGLVILSPLFALVSLLIKIDSPGPVFYRGGRMGKDGKSFYLYKFRSMVRDAEDLGPAITHRDDPRVTRLGRFLRKTKIDEIPQLINVLKGEMSLVGPRPEAPSYVEHYTSEQRRVFKVKPGITGPAQIKYRNEAAILNKDNLDEEYRTKVLPEKLSLDLDYIEHQSLFLDLKILLKTIIKVVIFS